MVEDLLERSLEPCKKALKDAGKQPKDIDEVILVGGSTRVPKIQEMVKAFFGKEPNRSVNPDEVVALGAAVQAGVLAGDVKDMLLLDVTPLSLGVETLGGIMTALIKRNTTIPHRKTEVFSTADDMQTAVTVKVYQGEREMARDNKLLGQFNLEGIPPSPRGVPQIEVTLDIDANGILNVSAKDKATGKENKITVQGGSGLSKDDVEKLVKEAAAHAEDDKKAREKVETKNQAEATIYQVEKTLKENGEKLPPADKANLEGVVMKAKEALKSEDLEQIKATQEELKQATFKLSEAMYASATPPTEGGEAPKGDGAAKKDGSDVVDAEFE